jgi:hypothetical protein
VAFFPRLVSFEVGLLALYVEVSGAVPRLVAFFPS